MMILTQDRKKSVRAGEYIYITNDLEIVNEIGNRKVVLGEYKTLDVAEEILKTIFQYLRCKKPCYAMPESERGRMNG